MSNASKLAPIVECISLTKVFQDFWGRDKVLAVSGVDLEIMPGEIFGLLGPNGSGKTTTIKMLLGLLYPTSGAIRVFGRPPTDTMIKSRIGFMPEESYLYRYLNARETLDYYGRLFKLDHHERNRRTEQLIEMVGLKRAARRPVGTYSKGMARRIGLAQALINDPDLLILDEPTTGLDPIGTRQIKDVIKTLGDRGKTVLLCSHLLADVEDVCDRVGIMYGGKRQALGDVHSLLQRQDVTQIRTSCLEDSTITKIREIVQKSGKKVLAVDHPTDRLEELFLRVVGQAQREQLETSGAESTTGVSEFLSGGDRPGRSIVQSLMDAAAPETTQMTEATAPEPVRKAPSIRKDVIAALSQEESPPQETPVEKEPEGPIELPKIDKANRAVLDSLLKPKNDSAPADSKDEKKK